LTASKIPPPRTLEENNQKRGDTTKTGRRLKKRKDVTKQRVGEKE